MFPGICGQGQGFHGMVSAMKTPEEVNLVKGIMNHVIRKGIRQKYDQELDGNNQPFRLDKRRTGTKGLDQQRPYRAFNGNNSKHPEEDISDERNPEQQVQSVMPVTDASSRMAIVFRGKRVSPQRPD